MAVSAPAWHSRCVIISYVIFTASSTDETSPQTGRVIPSLHVKKIEGKGFGIFAREKIQKGAYLFEYIGQVVHMIMASFF